MPLLECVFGCELYKPKAERLYEVGYATVFKDIEDLGNDAAAEWHSTGPIPVPDCDLLEFGFSCKDFSNLSQNTAQMSKFVLRMLTQFVAEGSIRTTTEETLGINHFGNAHWRSSVCDEAPPRVPIHGKCA